jgi:hypothetical protein
MWLPIIDINMSFKYLLIIYNKVSDYIIIIKMLQLIYAPPLKNVSQVRHRRDREQYACFEIVR